MSKSRTPITDPRDVPQGAKPDHGLDPEDQRFASRQTNQENITRRYAINPDLIFSITRDPVALKNAEDALSKKSWIDRIEWSELGILNIDTKPSTASGDSSGNTPSRLIAVGGNTSIAEARNKGFFNLQAAFERGMKTEFEEEKDVEREVIQQAQTAAKEALASILPSQAFLFVPPDELFKAQQEAEKLARDFAKEALNNQKQADKDAMKKGGKAAELKSSLGKKIRGLSLRHDGRMHIYPYTQQYAPETGIATVAVIESRHQSITGDHGRVRSGTR